MQSHHFTYPTVVPVPRPGQPATPAPAGTARPAQGSPQRTA